MPVSVAGSVSVTVIGSPAPQPVPLSLLLAVAVAVVLTMSVSMVLFVLVALEGVTGPVFVSRTGSPLAVLCGTKGWGTGLRDTSSR